MTDFQLDFIDPAIPARQSILLRYYPLLQALGYLRHLTHEELAAASIHEGARMRALAEHKGVEVLLADESSAMETGTYKALDACLTSATLRREAVPAAVVSSAGNLGRALARYASRLGIQVVFFHPDSTSHKLDSGPGWPGVTRISVHRPEPEVKGLAQAFAERWRLPLVPELVVRQAASAARAAFLVECAHTFGRFDRLAQTVCAGYGPLGIYDGFERMVDGGFMDSGAVPRFLGFQQDANAPLVRALAEDAPVLTDRHIMACPDRYLEPGLYNTRPAATYPRLRQLLRRFDGEVLVVDRSQVEEYADTVVAWLARLGLGFARQASTDGFLGIRERAGLLTGVGLVAAIERGDVRPGERVVYLLTGGSERGEPAGTHASAFFVDDEHSAAQWVEAIGRRMGLG